MGKIKVVQLCAFDSDVCKREFSCVVIKTGEVLRNQGFYLVVFWCKRFTMGALRCVDIVGALESGMVQNHEVLFT